VRALSLCQVSTLTCPGKSVAANNTVAKAIDRITPMIITEESAVADSPFHKYP
jgi:hypothetical protein